MDQEDFVSRLEGVRKIGKGFMACCPAHEDHSPSLSVSKGNDGRILLHCHAGCSAEDIVGALGLAMRDLFAGEEGKPGTNGHAIRKAPAPMPPIADEVVESLRTGLVAQSREYLVRERMLSDQVIARYRLGVLEHNGERRLSIPVVDGDGVVCDIRRWLSPGQRSKGTRKILHWNEGYGAPRFFPVDQLEHEELVFCEGELDSLALISHDLPAITLTAGCDTAPSPEQARLLTGKVVTILGDADEPGQRGALKRAAALAPYAHQVKIASWPEDRSEGWDATNELKAHGVESLKSVLAAAVPFESEQGHKDTDSAPTEANDPHPVTFVSSPPVDSQETEWPEPQPLPDSLPTVEPFEFGLLPEAFRLWIEDIAERMQCPPDFPAVGAMIVLAAVVGRQLAFRPKRADDWAVVANLWGAVVGRPGLLKTPALQEVRRPLDRLEAHARAQYETEMKDFEAEVLVAEAQQKNAKEQLRQALKKGHDPHEVVRAVAGTEGTPPRRRRYLVHDPTVEKLGEILRDNPRGVLVFRDELTGFLRTLDRDGHEGDRSFYLEAWNGTGRYSYDRIGRGTIDVDAACVSILGGIQPGPLSVYMARAAGGGGDDDGLVQRFQLMVWPDQPGAWCNVDRPPGREARRRAYEVFERLDHLNPVTVGAEVPTEEGVLPFLHFAPAAQEMFTEWRTELEHRLRSGNLPSMLEGHLAKYRSLIPSLALLIHLADVGAGPVGEAALRRACGWGDYLESHARRIYAPALAPAAGAAQALAERIRRGDVGRVFALREVQQKGWSGLTSREEIAQGLDLLEVLDWIRTVEEPTAGRPRTRYAVNPRLFGEGVSNGQVA